MQIVGVQLDIRWENPSVNHTIVSRLSAGVQPGSLVVLPEMFASGFTMNVEAATREWRETEQFVIDLAKRSGSTVVAGVASPGSDRHGRNQAVVVSPGGEVIGRYTKLHPFTLGGERDCYEAGSEIVMFDWQGFTVAPFVCYDLRFPEIFRVAARRGAN